MGQFSAQPPPSAGLRSPRPPVGQTTQASIQNTTVNAPDNVATDIPILSPYNLGNSSWASMTNTPMVPTFNQQQTATQADMVANATAMKLAALSTVNNRIALDDVRKYRRSRSNEGQSGNISQSTLSPGLAQSTIPGANLVMVNDAGQILNPQQIAALQAQQQAALQGRRSRPNSPGFPMQGGAMGQMGFASPQNNGYLTAYDGSSPMMNNAFGTLGMGQFGASSAHEGYLSDHSEMTRGRSPRGRRGSSKPPEDPTDPNLLQDIPTWLRSLRLHKYTDNLKDLKWTDLVELDDKGLEDRGVNALGARNKMLKVSLSPPFLLSMFTNYLGLRTSPRSESGRQAVILEMRSRGPVGRYWSVQHLYATTVEVESRSTSGQAGLLGGSLIVSPAICVSCLTPPK